MTKEGAQRKWEKLFSVVGYLLFGAAIWVIAQEVERVGWSALRRDFLAIPKSILTLALGLTAVAYLMLTLYDILAFRYIRHPLELRKIIFAAIIGYAFSNSISMTPSMAARFRLYSHWGLSGAEITRIFFFHYLSTWVGLLAVGGVIFLIEPGPIAKSAFLTFDERRWIGVGMLVLLAIYFLLGESLKEGVEIKGVRFTPPSKRILFMQLLVGMLDWSLVGVILYILFEGWKYIPYFGFLSVFLLAQVLQSISHVPGGIGVFEGTVLLLLKPDVPPSILLSSLIVYRVIYMVLPVLFAAPALLVAEHRFKRTP